MQVILLEKYRKANVGDVITVKDGFARNHLIPNKKAVQATKTNMKFFEEAKGKILKETEEKKSQAEATRSKIDGLYLQLIKQAGVDDRLYGSVTTNDVVKAIEEQVGTKLNRNTVVLSSPVKYLGCHAVTINLFADVSATVHFVVARTADEAAVEFAKLKSVAANENHSNQQE